MKKPTPPAPSSPLAQALVAGLLRGIGERYGDERLKAEGEKLAQEAIKAQRQRREHCKSVAFRPSPKQG